jgi:hypothetical protein
VEKCVNCQFYDRQRARTNDGRGAMWGQCRRTAPRLHPINAKSHMIEGVWPHVRDDDWCGDWKLTVQRVETRAPETAAGPLVPGFPSPVPLSLRPANMSALPMPGVTSLSGVAMAASGRGD